MGLLGLEELIQEIRLRRVVLVLPRESGLQELDGKLGDEGEAWRAHADYGILVEEEIQNRNLTDKGKIIKRLL